MTVCEKLDYLFSFPGKITCNVVLIIGNMSIFFYEGIRQVFTTQKIFRKCIQQLYIIGSKSLLIVSLIGLFTGMVLGLQGYYVLVQFGSLGFLGSAVSLTLIRELGPVLTAIMVTARAGSSMSAEIGVMRITDQIDALDVMGISSIGYLVSPRIISSLISLPLLTAVFDVVGVFGGYMTGVCILGITEGSYYAGIESSVFMSDIVEGIVKALVFSVLIAVICCYQGYNAHLRRDGKGPEAVANATTSAVVSTCVCVLIADYVVTSMMLR